MLPLLTLFWEVQLSIPNIEAEYLPCAHMIRYNILNSFGLILGQIQREQRHLEGQGLGLKVSAVGLNIYRVNECKEADRASLLHLWLHKTIGGSEKYSDNYNVAQFAITLRDDLCVIFYFIPSTVPN